MYTNTGIQMSMVLPCRLSLLDYNTVHTSTSIFLQLAVQCHISKTDWAEVVGFPFVLAEQHLGSFND